MTRRKALSMVVMVISMLILSAVLVAAIPLWVSVLLVKPDIATPYVNKIMRNAARQGMKAMVRL